MTDTVLQEFDPEPIRQAFGAVVARHRIEAGLKQRVFSRIIGISNSHLRSIESGKVSPTLVTICKIASALDVEPSELVSEACAVANASSKETAERQECRNETIQ